MAIIGSLIGSVLQFVILSAIPLGLYTAWHKLRHKRSWLEIRQRAGLVLGEPRYLLFSAGFAVVFALGLVLFPPSLEYYTTEHSPQRVVVGLGWSWQAWVMALAYGILKTGFPEELLVRGLLTGALSRRLPLWAANLIQALIFFAPHALILLVAPELWPILPIVFCGSLLLGWERIKSGSILGPWLVHATANVTITMIVAVRTAG